MKPMSERIADYNRKRAEMVEAMSKQTVRLYDEPVNPTDEQMWNAMWAYDTGTDIPNH